MRRALVHTATGEIVNVLAMEFDWTGTEGEWQPPADHEVLDLPDAAPGDTLVDGQVVKAVRVEVAPPTKEEIFDEAIAADPVLGALVEMINDGTFVQGANVDATTLKTAVADKMRAIETARIAAAQDGG